MIGYIMLQLIYSGRVNHVAVTSRDGLCNTAQSRADDVSLPFFLAGWLTEAEDF